MKPGRGPIVGREAELAAVRLFLGDHAGGPAALTSRAWPASARPRSGRGGAGAAPTGWRCGCAGAASPMPRGRSPGWVTSSRGWTRGSSRPCPRSSRRRCQRRCCCPATAPGRATAWSGWRCSGCCALWPGPGRCCWRSTTSSGWIRVRATCCPSRSGGWIASRSGCSRPAAPGVLGDVPADLGLPGERLVVGPVSVGVCSGSCRRGWVRLVPAHADSAAPGDRREPDDVPGDGAGAAAARRRAGGDEPLPVPADLRVLVTERLRGLSPQRASAAAGGRRPGPADSAAVAAAVGDPGQAARCLAEAVAAGVLELDGRAGAVHPPADRVDSVRGSAPATPPGAARAAGRAVTDPEERARHAALGSAEPSAVVAAALDVAALHARRRGSLDAAAELAELAVSRTPAGEPDELLRRSVDAARVPVPARRPGAGASVPDAGLDAAPPGRRGSGLLLRRRSPPGRTGTRPSPVVRPGAGRGRRRPAAAGPLSCHVRRDQPVRRGSGSGPRRERRWSCWRRWTHRRRPAGERADQPGAARLPARPRAGRDDAGACRGLAGRGRARPGQRPGRAWPWACT